MDELADFLRGFTGEGRFTATLSDLRGNVFDQDPPVINCEDLAYEAAFGGATTADMTLKHGHLRCR